MLTSPLILPGPPTRLASASTSRIGSKQQELAAVREQLSAQQAQNEELGRALADGKDAIIERSARADGYAKPNERIWVEMCIRDRSQTLPDDTADLVLAVAHRYLLLVLVRQNGTTTWVQQRPPQGDARTQEYALCRMLYTCLLYTSRCV